MNIKRQNLIIELKDCWLDSLEIPLIKDYEIKYNPLGKYFMIHVLHYFNNYDNNTLLQTDITVMKENLKYCHVTKEERRD